MNHYYQLDSGTAGMFRSVIEQLHDVFDSHDFIRELIRQFPQYYDQLLNDRNGMRVTNAYIARILSKHATSLSIEKVRDEKGGYKKVRSKNMNERISSNQLWRKFLLVLTLMLFVPSCFAQLSISRVTRPSNISDDEYLWQDVIYDFESKTMNPIYTNAINDRQIEVTVYEHDFKINRTFTITLPEGYTDLDGFCAMNYLGGRFENSHYFKLTKNLFTKSGLIEGILACKDSSGENVLLFIDEKSKILGSCDDYDLGYLIDPELVNGKIIFTRGIMVDNEGSGIQSIYSDQTSSSVSPNPTNGANSVAISWDYELLEDGELIVVGIDGKLVHTQTIKAGTRNASLSTGRLAAGGYIYVVKAKNGYISTGKIIVN